MVNMKIIRVLLGMAILVVIFAYKSSVHFADLQHFWEFQII